MSDTVVDAKPAPYRSVLYRDRLASSDHYDRTLGWVMLNPSKADAFEDDPTIRKVCGFTIRGGYHRACVVNLYPMRATDPRDLWRATEDQRLGPSPDRPIELALAGCDAIVLAWGAHGSRCPARVQRVLDIVWSLRRHTMVLGMTKGGQPLHPLMVGYAVPLREAPSTLWPRP